MWRFKLSHLIEAHQSSNTYTNSGFKILAQCLITNSTTLTKHFHVLKPLPNYVYSVIRCKWLRAHFSDVQDFKATIYGIRIETQGLEVADKSSHVTLFEQAGTA